MNAAKHIAIIGGGPAGLKAAETLAIKKYQVSLFEAKRSVGRKFLVAGKSGLNLTNDEDFESFLTRYSNSSIPSSTWRHILTQFSPQSTRDWAQSLGINTFVSSGNKVFPEQMKAAPLLRHWVQAIKQHGAQVHVNHSLTHIDHSPGSIKLTFTTPTGTTQQTCDALVLALGGGSWPQTGSNGDWVELFRSLDINVNPLRSANCGWHVDWAPAFLEHAEGLPMKNILISSEKGRLEGEVVITKYGLEGGPIYRLGPQIHRSKHITLDLKPTFSIPQLLQKIESVKHHVLDESARRWKLNPASHALLKHHLRADQHSKEQLATLVKNLPLTLTHPRPIEEAISSAGGVCWSELNPDLSLKKNPNIFVAGEMLDWEAPTGGFLLQGCLASGYHVGQAISSKL